MLNKIELDILQRGLEKLAGGSEHLPDFSPDFDADAVAEVIDTVAVRMQDNYPYFHPQYAGQMLKPPHAVARIAYALSLWVNPNNHALDGGRASSAMEKECIVELGRIFAWDGPLGHLTGGGTMANLEALWVAGRLHHGKRVLACEQAHYTHNRITEVLGIPFTSVPADQAGRMDLAALESELQDGDVGTVVATMGNTGLGAVDPLPEILELCTKHDARVHADAAYGGYFTLANKLDGSTRQKYAALSHVDSIVIDPHKHGLQPYGCGCVMYRDPSVGTIYQHDSPYTYFSSAELHLGEISLECSRPGAAAVALWATQKLLPPVPGGEFAQGLDHCLSAARTLHELLDSSNHYIALMPPELDIVVYAVSATDTETASKRARRVFDIAAEKELHLALIDLPIELAGPWLGGVTQNSATITCLRSVLMKPEQAEWVERIFGLLDESASEV